MEKIRTYIYGILLISPKLKRTSNIYCHAYYYVPMHLYFDFTKLIKRSQPIEMSISKTAFVEVGWVLLQQAMIAV